MNAKLCLCRTLSSLVWIYLAGESICELESLKKPFGSLSSIPGVTTITELICIH